MCGLVNFLTATCTDQISPCDRSQAIGIFVFQEVKNPTRIERWVLCIQAFDYTFGYKPGSENIADALSRLSCCHNPQEGKMSNIAEEYVRLVPQRP